TEFVPLHDRTSHDPLAAVLVKRRCIRGLQTRACPASMDSSRPAVPSIQQILRPSAPTPLAFRVPHAKPPCPRAADLVRLPEPTRGTAPVAQMDRAVDF